MRAGRDQSVLKAPLQPVRGRQPHHEQQRLVGYADTLGNDVFVARGMTLPVVVPRRIGSTPDIVKLAPGLSNGGRRANAVGCEGAHQRPAALC